MTSRSERIAGMTPESGRMLGPSAYSEALLPSLRLARSSRLARRTGKAVLLLLLLGFAVVAMAPWQQFVTGKGDVIAFSPGERRQTIEAPIKGRIIRWGENIFENARVKKGDFIAEIHDVDPQRLQRLQSQLETTKAQVEASRTLLEASERSRDAAQKMVQSQESLLLTYRSAKDQIVAAADAAVAAARNKVEAARRHLDEARAALIQLEPDYHRQKTLFQEQIVAEAKYQQADRKFREAQAKVAKAIQYVESAENDLTGKQRDRDARKQKAQADIDYAAGLLDKARGDAAKAESSVAKARGELNKAQKMLLEMQTKVARQQSQKIVAPFDGTLTSITPNLGGQMLKEGDTLCVIVPDTEDRAVQIWLKGNDAPLVQPGRHVRLQFEGWPAVQLAGWPSVAVGMFGGTVVSVDAIDDGKGRFRILVRPDKDVPPWPDRRFLRQGVRANGWVLLERVPLWYEIWRNMNGFPPVVTDLGSDMEKPKKHKLPK